MTERDDVEYFSRRAMTERKIAAECSDPGVAATHRRLAEEYERRTRGEGAPRRTLQTA